MTTSTDYPFRSGQLRRAGVLMKLPRVVIAAVVWLLAIEALPGPAAWGVLAVVVVGTVAGVVAESVVVRLVWWARRPAAPLAVSGDSGFGSGSRVDRLRGLGRPDAATSSSRRPGSDGVTYPHCSPERGSVSWCRRDGSTSPTSGSPGRGSCSPLLPPGSPTA